MKKLIFLSFLQLFVFSNLTAQQTNDLRGARYYYSLPFYGVFGPNLNHFKPNQIDEVNDSYFISGYFNYGITFKATSVKLNKFENSVLYANCDFTQTGVACHTILPNKQELVCFSAVNTSNSSNIDDSIRTLKYNSNGTFLEKKFATEPYNIGIFSFEHFKENINLASGYKDYKPVIGDVWPFCWPYVIQFDDQGNLTDSIQLPITNVYNNFPVYYGEAYKTFKYKEGYLTFGNYWRSPGDAYPNQFGRCPVLWHWNTDTVLLTREVYEGFSGNSNVVTSDQLNEMDGNGNEFVISVYRPEDGNAGNNLPFFNYLSFIDSNLNVVWDRKIGTLPIPYQYTLDDLKYDAENGVIYATGFVESETDPWYRSLFLAKYRRNGTQIYIKHFIINEFRNTSINCMSILDDGDLIFAGRGRDSLSNAFFFTYRTGPDGYHEDGAYLGLEEVLASETEIGIFPNPSDGIFQVSSISTEPMRITMLDQQGKQVAQFELNEISSDNSFDLSDQAPGVYFAHISQGEQQWVKKLVVR
jgi:hypothetical protein